ncbi:MAG: phosphate ABC transporter permease subunit PstC [Thermodesulfobacteriota bacterium]
MPGRQAKEKIIRRTFFVLASAGILTLLAIALFLFIEGFPIFRGTSVQSFFLGLYWYPTSDPPDFGILALMVGSLSVVAVSAAVAVPLGLATAVYLAEIASPRMREIAKPVVELLAALPSVVIGFFGMVVVAPFLQQTFDLPTGLNALNAGLMLAFMSVPTICSLSEDALYAVPNSLREASLALGATHLETIVRVVLPASISGIGTAVILGLSRAMGETMVVLMVAGGAAMIPESLFDSVRPMTATIAAEMAEAPVGGSHYHALFAVGAVLFLFTFAFNLVADWISHRFRQVGEASL